MEASAPDLVVEATRTAGPDPLSTPTAVTVIEVGPQLSASADVGSALDAASGATVSRMGGLGDGAAVSLRGSTLRQVAIFLDGAPLNPDGADVVNLSELPLGAFSRLEVYRGGAPPEFAQSPIGGAINLVTKPEGATSASVMGATPGTVRASGSIGGGQGRVHSFGYAEGFGTQGDYAYYDDNGTPYNWIDDRLRSRQNNQDAQLNALGRVAVGDDGRQVALLGSALAHDEALPGQSGSPATAASLRTRRVLGVATARGGTGAARGLLRVWGQARTEAYDDRLGELGTGSQWTQGDSATVGGLGQVKGGLAHLLPALTLSARRDRYQATDLLTGAVADPRARSVYTATASADAWLWADTLGVSAQLAGTLLDNRDLGGVSGLPSPTAEVDTTALAHLDPRLGLILRPSPGWAIKANGGRALRPPDITELFGDRGSIAGNPELRPESAWFLDLGGRASLAEGAVTGAVDATVFGTWTSDLIAYRQTGQRVIVPVNIGAARVLGVEASAVLRWSRWIETTTNLTLLDAQNRSDDPSVYGNQLPLVPRWDGAQQTALIWSGRVPGRLGHSYTYTDGNWWDATNWYRAAPRSSHGAFLRLSPGGRPLSVELDVLNLTNRLAEVVPLDPLNPDDGRRVQSVTDWVGYPLPGRTFALALRWSPEPVETP